jgi:hypothetical protein
MISQEAPSTLTPSQKDKDQVTALVKVYPDQSVERPFGVENPPGQNVVPKVRPK